MDFCEVKFSDLKFLHIPSVEKCLCKVKKCRKDCVVENTELKFELSDEETAQKIFKIESRLFQRWAGEEGTY